MWPDAKRCQERGKAIKNVRGISPNTFTLLYMYTAVAPSPLSPSFSICNIVNLGMGLGWTTCF